MMRRERDESEAKERVALNAANEKKKAEEQAAKAKRAGGGRVFFQALTKMVCGWDYC